MEVVERLIWLYMIGGAGLLILGVWLGHVITLAAQRAWREYGYYHDESNR